MTQVNSWWGRAAVVAGLGASVFTVGCGGLQNAGQVQALAASQTGAPVVVSCEPSQRAVVRPAANGAASQVECVTTGQPAAFTSAPALPVGTMYQEPAPRVVAQDVALGDARVIPASYPVSTVRPVRTRQVVTDDRPVRVVNENARQGRSVKKSAIIVGSSAGIGAGIGAAVGGKKGALIGAAISGGGAAIWDQMTRRK